MPISIIIFLLVGLIAFIVYLCIRLQRAEEKAKKLEGRIQTIHSGANSPHLENIETVLNPHLFKNILNSVQSHAYQTYFALDKLANILDYILYESKNKLVSPKDEFDFAKELIEVNKIKLSPLFELTVKTRIDETDPLYTQKVIAPLISIDLIENAFKHADLQSSDAYISIVFELNKGIFGIIVSNKISSKASFRKEKGGIGSANFRQRLDLLYKGFYTLEHIIDDGAFIAHLKINLNEYKTKMLDS